MFNTLSAVSATVLLTHFMKNHLTYVIMNDCVKYLKVQLTEGKIKSTERRLDVKKENFILIQKFLDEKQRCRLNKLYRSTRKDERKGNNSQRATEINQRREDRK